MNTYTCKEPFLRENFPHSIIERDEHGGVVGTYKGYWNSRARRFTLYPDYNHPARVPGTVLKKHTVFDGYVRCTPAPRSAPSVAAKSRGDSHDVGIKSSTRQAMKDVIGQVKMKI